MEEFFNEYNTSNLLYTYFILDVPRDIIKIYSINKLFKKCIDHKYFKSLFYTPKTNIELKKSVDNYIENNSLNLPHISKWNTHLITNMHKLFNMCYDFNEDISQWNVSNVINMTKMFDNAWKFNQELNWNISNIFLKTCMFVYSNGSII